MGLIVLFLSFVFSGSARADIKYTVQKGDRLLTIAKKFNVDALAIKSANNMTNSHSLKVGQVLIIPGQGQKKEIAKKEPKSNSMTYTVKRGDTLASIAQKHGLTVAQLKELNRLKSNQLKVGAKLIIRKPVEVAKVKPRIEEELEEEDDEALEEGTPPVISDKWLKESSVPLGKWNSPYERSLFVKVVKSFLGAPYRFGGDSLKGLDCSAFVRRIYQIFDIQLPRTAIEQAQVGVRVERDELKEGDLVFFNTRRPFGHVGIYIGNNQFIHASSSRGERQVRIDRLDAPYYNKRFVKAVRLLEIKDGDDTT
ncbi:MAG: LysM peptidoglycan-binding domain-containing protein [Syntrophales bacterium]|nr:LysM peptidoglycan-binding domain-containing protein [Syntrophales bacterium]